MIQAQKPILDIGTHFGVAAESDKEVFTCVDLYSVHQHFLTAGDTSFVGTQYHLITVICRLVRDYYCHVAEL